KRRKVEAAARRFKEAQLAFDSQMGAIEEEEERRRHELRKEQEVYSAEKTKYNRHCRALNEKIEALKRNWCDKEPDAVMEHAELVLNSSRYPEWHQIEFELDYSDEQKV